MELKTWKRLFSIFDVTGAVGTIMILFNLIVAILLIVICLIGWATLAWKRWKIIPSGYGFWHLMGVKKRGGELPKDLVLGKMPTWLSVYGVFSFLVLMTCLFSLMFDFTYLFLFVFYAWIMSLFVVAYYVNVVK